jgi:AcrR family transcriptional regulator
MPATGKALEARPGKGRRRTQSRGDLKEAAILACAWELLASKPVAEITIEQLASGAGISRPTFYFYFDSRESVIRALSEQVADGLLETVTTPLGHSAEPPDVLIRAMAERYMHRWRREGPILRAMAPLYESDPEHRAFWDSITGRIKDALAEAIEAERARGRALPGPPDAGDLARILMGMFWRAGYELSLSPRSTRADTRVIDTLTTVCLRAIYGQQAS